jgi:hypothetical protein
MSRRSVLLYLMDIARETKFQVPTGEMQQAIQDACDEIDQKGNWEFLICDSLLRLEAPYSTGTISVADGSANVFLAGGGTWDTTWTMKMLSLGGQLGQRVALIPSATTAVLEQPYSGPTLSGVGYSMYQARYLLPADCKPGADQFAKGPVGYGPRGDGEIPKKPRILHDRERDDFNTSGMVRWYTDDGIDEATNRARILFFPYPSTAVNLRVTYYRRFTVPTTQAATIMLPESFERLIIDLAAGLVMHRKGMTGWLDREQKARQTLADLYNQFAASSAYDLRARPSDDFPTSGRGGLFIRDSVGYLR